MGPSFSWRSVARDRHILLALQGFRVGGHGRGYGGRWILGGKQLSGNYAGGEKEMTNEGRRDKESCAGDHRKRTETPTLSQFRGPRDLSTALA